MMTVETLSSGKGHRDENFPVASFLIHPRHRPSILAFYRFARAADDISDNANANAAEKLRLLDDMQESLMGHGGKAKVAVALRDVLLERNLTLEHPRDLLEAFRRDVVKLRYASWDELMDYCRYSAMPVGRFVLDVHGEHCAVWPKSDALCAALQVINHLQDCAKDYRTLNRVYIPLDAMSAAKVTPEALGGARASPALRSVIAGLARRNAQLLEQSREFPGLIRDRRLSLEVAVIQHLAEDLNARLLVRDPLSEPVHHTRVEALGVALVSILRFLFRRRPLSRPGSRMAVH